MEAYSSGARAIREKIALGPPQYMTVDDWITGIKQEIFRLNGYVGQIESVREHVQGNHQPLLAEVDEYRKRLFDEKSHLTGDNMLMFNEIALKSIKQHGMGNELDLARKVNGDAGANDLLVRHYILNDAIRSGLPLSMLEEDPSNPHSKMFKYITPQSRPFITTVDKDGNEAVVIDENGNPKVNRLLDLGSTLAAYKEAKRIELQKRGKVTASVQLNEYGEPIAPSAGGDALSSALGQGTTPRTGPLDESLRLTGPTFQLNKGQPMTPQDKDIAIDADDVWEFLRPEAPTWEVGGGLFSFTGPKTEERPTVSPETSGDIPVDPVTGIPDIPPPRIKIPIPKPAPLPTDERFMIGGEQKGDIGPSMDQVEIRGAARRLKQGQKPTRSEALALEENYPIPESFNTKWLRGASLIKIARAGEKELHEVEKEILYEMNIDPSTGVPFGGIKDIREVTESMLLKKGGDYFNADRSYSETKDKNSDYAKKFKAIREQAKKEIAFLKEHYSLYDLGYPIK